MSHIFISYSRKDSVYARRLADHLLSQGFDVWIDGDISYGDDWWRAINRAMKTCGAVIVIMTPNSDQSRWVQREITLADELDIPTFPLLLAGDLLHSEHWSMFVRTQCFDVRDERLPSAEFFEKLGRKAARRATRGVEVTDKPRMRALPEIGSLLPSPFDWCAVDGGRVTLRDARDYGGTPGGQQIIDDFYIARFPITNGQYQVFAEALNGYRETRWWDYSADAANWRAAHPYPDFTGFPGSNVPRTNVSWFDAVAFSRWLNAYFEAQLPEGMVITLPTESQWQRAALGDLYSFYPWGLTFDRMLCNLQESGANQPTPVTHFLGGASPYDVVDMVGNVWEWCLSDWRSGAATLNGGLERAVRGGSWLESAAEIQAHTRDGYRASHTLHNLGFRVVLAPA